MLDPWASTAASEGMEHSVLLRKQSDHTGMTCSAHLLSQLEHCSWSMVLHVTVMGQRENKQAGGTGAVVAQGNCKRPLHCTFTAFQGLILRPVRQPSPISKWFIAGTSKGHFHVIPVLGGRNLVMSSSKTIKSSPHDVAMSWYCSVILGALCAVSPLPWWHTHEDSAILEEVWWSRSQESRAPSYRGAGIFPKAQAKDMKSLCDVPVFWMCGMRGWLSSGKLTGWPFTFKAVPLNKWPDFHIFN